MGIKNPRYGKTYSEEIRFQISAKLKGHTNTPSYSVTILDLETNITTTHLSIRKAAKFLNCDKGTIKAYNTSQVPFRGRYMITIHH